MFSRFARLLADEAGEAALDLLTYGTAGGSQLKVLRQRRADQNRELAALNGAITTANRAMTDEERAQFAALKGRQTATNEQLEIAEQLNESERTERPVASDPDVAIVAAAQHTSGIQVGKDLALDDPKLKVSLFGRQLQAVRNFAVSQGQISQADRQLLMPMQAAASGLNESVPSEGGFLVDQDRVSTIRERMYETGNLLSRVHRVPLGANSNGMKFPAVDETSRANGSRFGGIQSYWLEEAGEKLPSKPKFRMMDLLLKKVAALVYSTEELLADAAALEAWIMRHLPDELIFRVEDAIVNGTGSGMPLGFLNGGGVITVTRSTASRILWEDIVAMWSRLYAPSRKNAIWLIDQGAEAELFSMSMAVGTGGVPVFMPAGGASSSPYSTLFGRPIVPSEYGAAIGTTGDIMLVDPTQYTLIDKGGVQSAVSIHVRFVFDETAFRFVYRVDGQPDWNTALTPKSGGSTVAPVVVLS